MDKSLQERPSFPKPFIENNELKKLPAPFNNEKLP
jgi:hypothetical protein